MSRGIVCGNFFAGKIVRVMSMGMTREFSGDEMSGNVGGNVQQKSIRNATVEIRTYNLF